MSELLHLHCEGATPERPKSKLRALQLIFERDDFNYSENVIASSLSAEMRLLHNFIGRILFPKSGRFVHISERDLVIMEHVIQGIPLNLPAMMIRQMREAICKSRVFLPYVMILTLVFRQHDISVEGEISRHLLFTDTYTARSLVRMGYEKVNGQWVRGGAGMHAPEDDAPEVGDSIPKAEVPEDHPTAPSEAGPSSSVPTGCTEEFWSRMTELVSAQVRTLSDGLTSRMDIMTAEIRDLREQVGALQRERLTVHLCPEQLSRRFRHRVIQLSEVHARLSPIRLDLPSPLMLGG